MQSSTAPTGALKLRLVKRQRVPEHELSLWEFLKYGLPHFGLRREVALWRFKNIPNFAPGLWRIAFARLFRLPHFYGQLSLCVVRKNGEVVDFGLASMRVVTTTGVGYIVDAFQTATSIELENMKFHGFGTGATAAVIGDTGLQTELTTQYVGNVRPTGTTEEGASANIYKTVATLAPDSGTPISVTEHGVFSANAAGVMIDRTVFTAVPVDTGESLLADYQLTFTAGG